MVCHAHAHAQPCPIGIGIIQPCMVIIDGIDPIPVLGSSIWRAVFTFNPYLLISRIRFIDINKSNS